MFCTSKSNSTKMVLQSTPAKARTSGTGNGIGGSGDAPAALSALCTTNTRTSSMTSSFVPLLSSASYSMNKSASPKRSSSSSSLQSSVSIAQQKIDADAAAATATATASTGMGAGNKGNNGGGHFKDKVNPNLQAGKVELDKDMILKEIHKLYYETPGIVATAKSLAVEILKPRKKINVLLIGNHSAGKSSFINWYINEPILRTGVAMETQRINVIMNGSRRETLQGPGTLELLPFLSKLKKIPGVVNSLVTEITSSKSKNFEFVTFIDTPGLVDGNMNYPFDVNKTLLTLGEMADLILVFFDPIGQALCKRTLDIVEGLWKSQGAERKIRLYLAKADEAGNDRDRQKVLMQIVQELCKRPGINRTGFDMPTIYIPSPLLSDAFKKGPRCINQIEETCTEIEKAVASNVQNALDNMKTDIRGLLKRVGKILQEDEEAFRKKMLRQYGVFGGFMVVSTMLSYSLANGSQWPYTLACVGFRWIKRLFSLLLESASGLSPWDWLKVLILIMFVVLIMFIVSVFRKSEQKIDQGKLLSGKQRKEMKASVSLLQKSLDRQRELYLIYLRQSMPDVEITRAVAVEY